jgi:hypothetical protein
LAVLKWRVCGQVIVRSHQSVNKPFHWLVIAQLQSLGKQVFKGLARWQFVKTEAEFQDIRQPVGNRS